MLSLGVRHFALLFDDLPGNLTEADADRFGSVAGAQCDVANEIYDWLHEQLGGARLLFCPTPYCDRMDRWNLGGADYLAQIGDQLTAEIEVLWTGPEIISGQIPVSSLQALSERLKRKPVIWDNLHANDYDVQRAFCGPYSGRSPELLAHVRGILANPNCEFELNFVPLHTLANFVSKPHVYDARQAYQAAVQAWLGRYRSIGEPFDVADLTLLGDCYYLPHDHGPLARSFHENVRWLIEQPTESWDSETLQEFERVCCQIEAIFTKLTELHNRDLFYAWSRRVWDLKEEVDLYTDLIQKKRDGVQLADGVTTETHLPKTYRGGIVAEPATIIGL